MERDWEREGIERLRVCARARARACVCVCGWNRDNMGYVMHYKIRLHIVVMFHL